MPKMYLYAQQKVDQRLPFTTEFFREIIEIAVQLMNQIYTVLHLYINRNGSFNQEDLHARTYEETFVHYDYNLNIKI